MKKIKSFKKSLVIALLFGVISCCLPAYINAEELDSQQKGTISIHVDSGAEGIVMELYEVADYQNTRYELHSDFIESNVDFADFSEPGGDREVAEKLEFYVRQNSIKNIKAIFDSNGDAVFTELSLNKLYLIVQEGGTESDYLIQPILACPQDGAKDLMVDAKFFKETPYSSVILNKIDTGNHPLQDAWFSFQSKVYNVDGTYDWEIITDKLVTNSFGQIVVEELPFGTYRFIETKAPEGYVLDSTPHEFTVDAVGTVRIENGRYQKDSGIIAELTVINEPIPPENPPKDPSEVPPTPSSDRSDTVVYLIMLIVASIGVLWMLHKRFAHKI